MSERTTYRGLSEALDVGTSVRHSWAAIKRCWPILWVGGVMRSCTRGGSGGGGNSGGGSSHPDEQGQLWDFAPVHHAYASFQDAMPGRVTAPVDHILRGEIGAAELGVMGLVVGLTALVLLVVLAFRSWVVAGWYRVHKEIIETGAGSFTTLFGSLDCFGRMFGWSVLQGLVYAGLFGGGAAPLAAVFLVFKEDVSVALIVASSVWALAWAVATIYVYLGLTFADHMVVLDGATGTEAFWGSMDLVRGQRVHLFFWQVVVGFVAVLLGLSGLLLLCIGALVTAPLAQAMSEYGLTEGYLRMTRPPDETSRWPVLE